MGDRSFLMDNLQCEIISYSYLKDRFLLNLCTFCSTMYDRQIERTSVEQGLYGLIEKILDIEPGEIVVHEWDEIDKGENLKNSMINFYKRVLYEQREDDVGLFYKTSVDKCVPLIFEVYNYLDEKSRIISTFNMISV